MKFNDWWLEIFFVVMALYLWLMGAYDWVGAHLFS
jgi:hypothetical protein